jgi:hypothetical protein
MVYLASLGYSALLIVARREKMVGGGEQRETIKKCDSNL